MKLLMISGDRTVAAGKGGAFTETLRELSTHFERIDILCPRVEADRVVRQVYGNVHLHPASGGLLGQPGFIVSRGKELIHEFHHEVATVHDYPPFLHGLGARMLKARTGIPLVSEVHHIVGWPAASSLVEWIGRWMTRLLIASHERRFDAVRVVNATVRHTLAAWGVEEGKIRVVPSVYLDHAVIDGAKHQPKRYDLVFASRLVDNKGLLPAISALAELPGKSMLVVGDGPLRPAAMALVRSLSLLGRVTFTGWLGTPADVAAAIASGRVFIMNSKSEGNPRVAIEAMALGLPVLSTKVGLMPDVVREGVNGVFTNGTARDLAAKASELLSDPSAVARMGAAASAVRDQFEKKAAIKAYADFLSSTAR